MIKRCEIERVESAKRVMDCIASALCGQSSPPRDNDIAI
jgi:hypothetical protein